MMTALRTLLIILILGLAVFVSQERGTLLGGAARADESSPTEQQAGIPKKAYKVLEYIRQNGHAPEGYVGGREFQNREGRLPYSGEYREFDVDPHLGGRNAERLIVDWRTKKAWYTGDHYRTFIPMP